MEKEKARVVKCPKCGHTFVVKLSGNPDEEEEYEEIRRRARLAKGKPLLPV